jgi:hypothetical protein
MFISEPSLLDREQAMALKGALEMWQKEEESRCNWQGSKWTTRYVAFSAFSFCIVL